MVCSKSIDDALLSRLFRSYPGMEYCDLKRDRGTGRSKGYAYINYSAPGPAAAAIRDLNGVEFPPGSGCRLKVMPAEILGGQQQRGLAAGRWRRRRAPPLGALGGASSDSSSGLQREGSGGLLPAGGAGAPASSSSIGAACGLLHARGRALGDQRQPGGPCRQRGQPAWQLDQLWQWRPRPPAAQPSAGACAGACQRGAQPCARRHAPDGALPAQRPGRSQRGPSEHECRPWRRQR